MEHSTLGTLLLLINALVTYKGFSNKPYFNRYKFEVDGILIHKEYDRIITSGFLHANWFHFGFNMIALLSFSVAVEQSLGVARLAIIYLCSLVGSSLLSLYIHKEHGDYSAVGASGAVSGIVFTAIILFPTDEIGFILLPIKIESWLMGLIFIGVSIFGIKAKSDNIGHEAHLGGALTGVLTTILVDPFVLKARWDIILLVLIPMLGFLYWIIRNPEVLLIPNYWGREVSYLKEKSLFPKKDKTLDELLDKIAQEGIDKLTKKEKELLDRYRKEMD